MRALVVYESMFGNTRAVAEAIAKGLESAGVTTAVAPASTAPDPAGYDLVLVGAPTHAHTLPQPSSRTEAAAWARDPVKGLTLEPTAHDSGVREWIKGLGTLTPIPRFAAFATRVDMPRIFTGDASTSIAKRLKKAGIEDVEKECYLVSSANVLVEGEADRAATWAASLATSAAVPR
jgi:Flavodoxin domain